MNDWNNDRGRRNDQQSQDWRNQNRYRSADEDYYSQSQYEEDNYPRNSQFGRGDYEGGDWQQGSLNRRGGDGQRNQYGDGNRDFDSQQWDRNRYASDMDRQQNSQGFGQQQQSTPIRWTYTEYWIVPGPFTGRGPEGYQRGDERIMEEVCERLTQHGQIDASGIQVRVTDGEVTLSGSVNTRDEKRMAEDAIESISGVNDVQNKLRVQKQNGDGAKQKQESETPRTTSRQRQTA